LAQEQLGQGELDSGAGVAGLPIEVFRNQQWTPS